MPAGWLGESAMFNDSMVVAVLPSVTPTTETRLVLLFVTKMRPLNLGASPSAPSGWRSLQSMSVGC